MQKSDQINCPVCNYIVDSQKNYINGINLTARVMCPMCSLIFFINTNYPLPVYDRNYNMGFFRSTDIKKAGLVAHELSEIIGSATKKKKILDVGTGNGLLPFLLSTIGYDVDAIDLDKNLCDYLTNLTGIEIKASRFEDYAPGMKYDLIYASHVIEHIQKPMIFIQQAYNLLAERGLFYIDTPNTEYQNTLKTPWKHYRTRNLFEHCCLFCPKTFNTIEQLIDFKIVTLKENEKYESLQVILQKK